ncbi:MAG: thermonuclease family protein [Myxococcota bacterium]
MWLASTSTLVGCLVTSEVYDNPRPERGDTVSLLTDPVPVNYVVDGDTIDVAFNGTNERIRFKGIDTPELHPQPDGSLPEPFAEEAKDFVLLNIGTEVDLEFDSTCPQPPETECRDSTPSRRLLAYIRITNGADLGAMLLEQGLARVFIYAGEPFDRMLEYQAIEQQARDVGRGIWGP